MAAVAHTDKHERVPERESQVRLSTDRGPWLTGASKEHSSRPIIQWLRTIGTLSRATSNAACHTTSPVDGPSAQCRPRLTLVQLTHQSGDGENSVEFGAVPQ